MAEYTRREMYLSAIVNGSGPVPDPYTREDCYLAKIAGADVSIPSAPLTMYERYLAKLAGQDVSVPAPTETSPRLFWYLYKACGGDCTVPPPITREEILWAQYDIDPDIRPDPETGGIIVPKGGAITSFTLTYTFNQHGTGDASAENIRPIDRYDGDIIYVSGADTSNLTEYVIDWSETATYYGAGTLDVLTGVLTETHRSYDISDWEEWSKASSATYPYFYISVVRPKNADVAVCSHLMDKSGITGSNKTIGMRVYIPSGGTRLLLRPWIDTEATKTTFMNWLQAQKLAGTPVQVGYERNAEATYEITPPEITLNNGVTRIWAKYGSISMTYIPGAPMADSAKADEAILTE